MIRYGETAVMHDHVGDVERCGDLVGLPSDDWFDDAVPLVTAAVNTLVREFARHPCLHRVEHSLHVRLYSLLVVNPLFSGLAPLGDTGRFTQPVHKEWPETVAREGHGRGNFDLAILSQDQLRASTLEDFRAGRIPAGIAIELGLDYDLEHLRNDRAKLIHSGVPFGYLVNFSRNGRGQPDIERWVTSLNDEGPQIAYVHHAAVANSRSVRITPKRCGSVHRGGNVGLIRKTLSVTSLGAVDFRSDKERIARSTRKTWKATKKASKYARHAADHQAAIANAALVQRAQLVHGQQQSQTPVPAQPTPHPVSPGWYRHPTAPSIIRYWDGREWTAARQA